MSVETNPRHPRTGKFTSNPSTGRGHIEQASADHLREIDGSSKATPVERAAREAEALRHRRGSQRV
jgi:hypothetical protein